MPSGRYPKRRRVSGAPKEGRRSYNSSPDELAASSDHDKYHSLRPPLKSLRENKDRRKTRADSNNSNVTAVIAVPAESSPNDPPAVKDTEANIAAAAASIEDSPDELDHTIHTFYRGGFRGSFSKDSRQAHEKYISQSPPPYSRISSPVVTPRTPPIRPPQYVPYKEKTVLKGHRKGIAAVRFSPDGRFIASCCKFTNPMIDPLSSS